MKKLTLIIALFVGLVSMNAQDKEADSTKQGWTKAGQFSLLFNQSAFNNNWTAGGVSSIAGNLSLNYDFNYVKDDIIWDNKFIAAYGVTKIDDAENFTKTDDRLEFTSLLGKEVKNSATWFYSAFLNFKTQMDSGFDADGNKTTHFFSPAYLQVGPGMLWKKSDNLKVNIAPATARFIFVHDEFTAVAPGFEDEFNDAGGYFGVEANETSRFEFGASLNAYYKFTLVENVTFENLLNLYSNYLDKPQNVDIDYTANIAMKINKFMSANIAFQAIYDDNVTTNDGSKGFQIREVFGLGFNYTF
jgi:hypothetical protein